MAIDEPAVAPVEEQDTPAVDTAAAPTEDTPQAETAPETDWKQRYEDLRPEFDRRNELLSAAQGLHGPEAQAEALRQFGVELEQEEAESLDNDFADPMEEIQKIKEQLAQRDESAKAEEFNRLEAEYIDKTVEELEAKHGIELSDKAYDTVVNNALAHRLNDDRPDIEGAFSTLLALQDEARKSHVESKKNAPKAPVGAPGEEKIDLRDPEARRKYMAEIIEAEEGTE